MKKVFLYWLRLPNHNDILSQGYIGVTNNVERRWARHNRHTENEHLKNVIKKYGWENIVKEILVISSEEYCYYLENVLRPNSNTGWNICSGGGKPPISKPRGPNYKSPLKGVSKQTPWMVGRKLTKEQCAAISERRKVKVKYNGVTYDSLQNLAKKLNLNYSTLTNRAYRNPKKWGIEVIR